MIFELILCIVIVLAIVYIIKQRKRHHEYQLVAPVASSLYGLYINPVNLEGSQFYKANGEIETQLFKRHRQGTLSYLDEEWTKVNDTNTYHITSPSGLFVSKHAFMEEDKILVYEEDVLVETLERHKEECKMSLTDHPTFANFNELYNLVEVSFKHSNELEKIIHKQKACANYNDIHMHNGKNSALYIARGMFAIDKKKTAFYYVPRNILPMLVFEVDPKPILLDISYFHNAAFIGCMAGS